MPFLRPQGQSETAPGPLSLARLWGYEVCTQVNIFYIALMRDLLKPTRPGHHRELQWNCWVVACRASFLPSQIEAPSLFGEGEFDQRPNRFLLYAFHYFLPCGPVTVRWIWLLVAVLSSQSNQQWHSKRCPPQGYLLASIFGRGQTSRSITIP